jgi:hypothetical protein
MQNQLNTLLRSTVPEVDETARALDKNHDKLEIALLKATKVSQKATTTITDETILATYGTINNLPEDTEATDTPSVEDIIAQTNEKISAIQGTVQFEELKDKAPKQDEATHIRHWTPLQTSIQIVNELTPELQALHKKAILRREEMRSPAYHILLDSLAGVVNGIPFKTLVKNLEPLAKEKNKDPEDFTKKQINNFNTWNTKDHNLRIHIRNGIVILGPNEGPVTILKEKQELTLEETLKQIDDLDIATLEKLAQTPELKENLEALTLILETLLKKLEENSKSTEPTESTSGRILHTLERLTGTYEKLKTLPKAVESSNKLIEHLAKEPNQKASRIIEAVRKLDKLTEKAKAAEDLPNLKRTLQQLSLEGDLVRALSLARKILRIQKESGADMWALAETAQEIERLQKALAKNVQPTQQNRRRENPDEDPEISRICREFREAVKRKNLDEATRIIEEGLKIAPDHRDIQKRAKGLETMKLILATPASIEHTGTWDLLGASFPLEYHGEPELALMCLEKMINSPELRDFHVRETRKRIERLRRVLKTKSPASTENKVPAPAKAEPTNKPAPAPAPIPFRPEPKKPELPPHKALREDLTTWVFSLHKDSQKKHGNPDKDWETETVHTEGKGKGKRRQGGVKKFLKPPEETSRRLAEDLEKILERNQSATDQFLAEASDGNSDLLTGMLYNNLLPSLRGGSLKNNGGVIPAILDHLTPGWRAYHKG